MADVFVTEYCFNSWRLAVKTSYMGWTKYPKAFYCWLLLRSAVFNSVFIFTKYRWVIFSEVTNTQREVAIGSDVVDPIQLFRRAEFLHLTLII